MANRYLVFERSYVIKVSKIKAYQGSMGRSSIYYEEVYITQIFAKSIDIVCAK